MTSALLHAALAYAARGLRVFPVGSDRVPLIRAWPTVASSDPVQIRTWWTSWPSANIRTLTGKRFFVLDIDPRHAGDRSLSAMEQEHGALPTTLTCETGGGGLHLYFETTGVRVATSQSRIGPGIDVLGERAAATLPPSIHASGRTYSWRRPIAAIALPPAWLLEQVAIPERPVVTAPAPVIGVSSQYARRAVEDEVSRVEHAPEGTRNRTLNAATFALARLAGAGLLRADDIESWMLAAAAACGLPHAEARPTIRSALRAGLARPRRVAPLGGVR